MCVHAWGAALLTLPGGEPDPQTHLYGARTSQRQVTCVLHTPASLSQQGVVGQGVDLGSETPIHSKDQPLREAVIRPKLAFPKLAGDFL